MSTKPANTETVKVMVRVRPMNAKEKSLGCKPVLKVDKSQNQIELIRPDNEGPNKDFAYDSVYDVDSKQQEVYDESAFPLVESVIKGYNGTIFAYGQTGCGKTHTMLGVPSNPELRGIIPNCFAHIFGFIDEKNQDMKFLVRCSYLEIYNEEIHDLLVEGKKQEMRLDLKEDPSKGVFVKDLTCCIVKSIPEIEKAMEFGTKNRKTASTNMNQDSSRSHSLFTIYIETAEEANGEERYKVGKLNLVDLAGSERSSKTGATGQTLKEGIKINLSLTALGNVISCLIDPKTQHIPYRDSKLTRLLQDSLGGNTKTVMIAACSPADYNYDETLSTLRYASRAKAIKNKPKVNEDPKDALLKQYEEEIRKLKVMLEEMNKGTPGRSNVVESLQKFGDKSNIKMNLVNSEDAPAEKEESVEELIRKLSLKGTKVKIIGSNDDKEAPPQQSTKPVAKRDSKPVTSEDQSNKENVPAPVEEEQALQQTPASKETQPLQSQAEQPIEEETQLQEKVERSNNQELDQLLTKNQELNLQKEQHAQQNEVLHSELMSKEKALEMEKKQKDELTKLIQEMEKKLVTGGHGMDDLSEQNKEQIRKERQLQKQLKKQKKKEVELLEEKRKKDEQMLFVQGNYTSLQQEVESMREIMEKLRSKYKGAEAEIKDLTTEHQQQKSELLDIVRSQEKAVKFSNKVMQILLSENELYKLHQRSRWDDERGDWTIPLFTFNPKTKDLNFPSINAKGRVEQSKDERTLQIQDDFDDDSQFRKQGNFKNGQRSKRKGDNGGIQQSNQRAFEGNNTGQYSGLYNHSADERSNENNRNGDQSWMEDRFSQGDNISHNNLRDSSNGNGIQIRTKNVTGGGSVNSLTNSKNNKEIIPERRRKYLAGASDDQMNPSVGQKMMGVDNLELMDDSQTIHKKNNKNNVHLQPLDHNPQTRNSSVPPNMQNLSNSGAPHPLNFAPSPNQRGGHNIRLESIDHAQHQIMNMGLAINGEDNVVNKLPSPMAGGKRKQLEPLK